MIGAAFSKVLTFLSKLPAFVLVFLFPLGLIVFIGSIITLFWALANIEGVASVIMVLAGYGMAKVLAFDTELIPKPHQPNTFANVFTAGIVAFYALMGMAIDQPGNYFFNKPIEWLACKEGTVLSRGVNVSHPLPGRTDMTQEYTCFNIEEQKIDKYIGLGTVIGVRFVEYVFIGFGLKELVTLTKKRRITGE